MAATDYRSLYEHTRDASPGWLHDLRRGGIDRFEQLGWPTRRHEEWKYTSTKGLQEQRFTLATPARAPAPAGLEARRVPGAVERVFVDGFHRPELDRGAVPAGVTIRALALAPTAEQADWVTPLRDEASTFAALNAALFQEGLLVEVARDVVCRPLIHLIHVFSARAEARMVFPRRTLRLDRGAEAAVLETLVSETETATLLDAVTDITVASHAQFAHGLIQAEGRAASQVQNTHVQLAADSRFEAFVLTAGGGWVRNDLHVTLDGSGIEAAVNGLVSLNGTQHVDNHTVIDHRQPQSTSRQLYKAVLDDEARSVFNGKIFVRDVAQQTNAYQLNRNLLLSPTAEADTKPQLEIFADDVRCTHGATVGPVHPDEIFYLQARGIERERAVRLLAHGFAREAVGQVRDVRLRPLLDACLLRHLGGGEA